MHCLPRSGKDILGLRVHVVQDHYGIAIFLEGPRSLDERV